MIIKRSTALERFILWWVDFFPDFQGTDAVLYIETLENPGWTIRGLSSPSFFKRKRKKKFLIERAEHNWLSVNFSQDYIGCAGGPVNLHDILEAFYSVMSGNKKRWKRNSEISENYEDSIQKIVRWFLNLCHEEPEDGARLRVEGLADGSWTLVCDTRHFHHKGKKDLSRQLLASSCRPSSWISVTNFVFKCQVAPTELACLFDLFLQYLSGEDMEKMTIK